MTTILKYRIYCITEEKFQYVWGENPPTLCPTDTSHTVNANSVSTVDEVSTQEVLIKTEKKETGGHYSTTTKSFDISAGTTDAITFSFPFPITLLTGVTTIHDSQKDDRVIMDMAPDTIIGIITSNVSTNDLIIDVDVNVITNSFVGGFINLFNGVNVSNLSQIIEKDSVNNKLTLKTGIDQNFMASSPTYVRFTVRFVDNVELGLQGVLRVAGYKTLGGSYVPANTNLRITYINNSGVVQHPVVLLEYLY